MASSSDFLASPEPPKKAWDFQPKLAEKELTRYGKLKSKRDSTFLSAWQTLGNYYLPNLSDIDESKTEGNSGWSDRIYDTTAIEAARTCTTGQSNWATPASEPWFAWSPPKYLNMEDDDEGAIWFGICTEIALDELARSNYYQISGSQYKSRSVFGTGQMHIEEGRNFLLNCSTRKIGTYCIDKNDEDFVDTVYSEFKLTARAAAQKFGEDRLTPKVKEAFTKSEGANMDKEFDFLHVIRPREETERMVGRIDPENKPVASIYIAMEDKMVVKLSGYDEMPDSVTRFDDWGTGTAWGYSPAFETLPNVRQLNYIVRFMDAQYELQANPRILTPVKLMGQLDLRPGGITPYDPNLEGSQKPEEWMSKMNLGSTEKAVQVKADAVNRMFYKDVFQALSQIKYKATAYEISQRLSENLEQLSPMFGRITTEKTGPDLKRIFGILYRAGKFPKPPKSMYVPIPGTNKMRLAMPEVTYTSRLALALKAMQNKGTMDTLNFVMGVAKETGRLDLLDNWDLDAAFRTYAINQGMSPRFERPMNKVIQLRQKRAQQQAQDRAMAMAEQASKAAKNLGGAPEQLQEQIGQQVQAPQQAA